MDAFGARPKFKFLCNRCAFLSGRYDVGRVTRAWAPDFMPQEDNNILACPRLHEVGQGKLMRARKTACDDCGAAIYYAPSSDWIVQNAERG